MQQTRRPPPALLALAAFYLFSLLLAASNLGSPFPFMGRFYQGRGGEWLGFAAVMLSLYLCVGILKRQRLTFWLVIGYNLLDICNALVNLASIAPGEYARVAGAALPMRDLAFDTLAAVLLLLLVTLYLVKNRRAFDNGSPYLF
jgi:hypothetical protein